MINFSKSALGMRSSEIRRLMALAADPSIISFAGGMPNNGLFPTEVLDRIYSTLPIEKKQFAFQYGPTGGIPSLIATLKKYLQSRGLPIEGNELIITTGAQQAISLLTKTLINEGDAIITEYPSFIGALAAFKSFGAELFDVPMDNDGIIPESLEKTIKKLAGPRLKMLYLCPCFHNPAGIVYSAERKKQLIKMLTGADIVLLEDDPYSELYFEESDKLLTVPIKATAGEAFPICYAGTFAKIFGPGMRLGWMLGPAAIIEKIELAKQSADACSSTFTQVLANEYLSGGHLPAYLDFVRKAYKRRAALMLDALAAHMPEGVTWTKPRGGFYVWVTLPAHLDSSKVFEKAIARGAAFVIGSAFDPQAKRNNSFRLAFSHTAESKIADGIKIIADSVKAVLVPPATPRASDASK